MTLVPPFFFSSVGQGNAVALYASSAHPPHLSNVTVRHCLYGAIEFINIKSPVTVLDGLHIHDNTDATKHLVALTCASTTVCAMVMRHANISSVTRTATVFVNNAKTSVEGNASFILEQS